jgi:hypothetical protein
MREKRFAQRADRPDRGGSVRRPNPAKVLFAGEFYYLMCRADCHANDMLRFDAPYRNVEIASCFRHFEPAPRPGQVANRHQASSSLRRRNDMPGMCV